MIDTKNLLLLAAPIALLSASFLCGENVCISLTNICAAEKHESTVDCLNYMVQEDDKLSEIVQRCGSSEAAIVSANKNRYHRLTKNHIEAGWKLKIPGQQ